MVRPSDSWALSVFGGKNSNENVRPAARRSDTRAIRSQPRYPPMCHQDRHAVREHRSFCP